GNEDGINWLDYKFFNINTALTNNNLNPVPTANLGCDTVTLCLTQTTPLNVEFLGPEPDQTVSLVVNSDLAGSCYIENESSSNGGTATYTGVFVAESPGISTVTMTAEDSDGAITEVNIVIQVLDVVPPTIDVTSATGEWGICAGSELDVTAASVGGQEPVVDWSWNLGSQFWTDNEATIPFGGTFVVTGNTASGCVVRELFEVFQTPYYLPTVEGTLQTVCPGDSALVEVIPDVNENFVDYIWTGNWNNGGGTVLSTNGASAYLTAGVYQVTVVDEGGCEGKRTFILSPSASTLPDITIDPLCGEAAFDTVTFSGGFASPGEGYVNLYLSSSINGWGGSFLSIDIIHEDGTVTTSTISMNSGNFANVNNNPDLAVAFGDSVQITFVSSDPANDQYLGLDLYNCVNNCINNPSACFQDIPLTSGVIYYGPAMCTVQPAFGLWEETSNLGNNEFSVTDQYNTTWWATEYGMYELCFYDEECGSATCYDVEVNEPPTIELSGDSLAWACDGDDLGIQAFITDPADVATVNWPYPGTDNVLENEYSWTQYTETTLVVSVSNGCGTASDQIEVTATLEPLLDNAFLCGEGSTLELDPIPGDQNTDLVYEWTYNGNPANVQDNEWEVDATGSYCVTVVNGCFPNGNSDCAFIDVIEEIDVDVFPGGAITDCDGGGIEVGEDGVLGVSNAFIANYNDYTVTWPDGTVTTIDDNFNWIVPEETDINGTEICVTIEDPYGCDPQEACGLVFIGDVPTWDPLPNIGSEPLALCPGTPELFDLNAQMNGPEYSDYTWTVQCSDTVVSFDAEIVVNLFNDQFPPNCWGYPLDLEVNIANPCLPGGLTHVYNIIVDNCEILVPNVFTPRDGNDENNGFHIMGLEPWEPNGVLVRIFDRWGNQVYENFQYRNATPWYGDESADGVYFYTVLLPNGDQHTGTVNIFRAR
ncbi:MAG: gliding motility-associated C-terminal domain-containing protein, partial [Bacteroidetes bacterium]|nr:gliding motility-associated C-terminal domain-containing protein [Bacteroidota bacterium]